MIGPLFARCCTEPPPAPKGRSGSQSDNRVQRIVTRPITDRLADRCSFNEAEELEYLRGLDEVRRGLGLVWDRGNFVEVLPAPDAIVEAETWHTNGLR